MTETNQNVIVTNKVTKVFRDFWLREKVTAVAELDLRIRPGEVFGLLGPNGSGKSTTLKMILGLLFPTRGQIAVFSRRPTDVATKSRIGFLPEESYLYPFLNAYETLDFYGRLFRLPRAERRRRIDMLLDMVGLTGVAYRRIGEYSKGMQRRIGLAQALINDPDLLILDEPTAGMDPIGTRQIKDLILTLVKRGKTVLLSSHLLADVEDVCDRVCILYGGRQRALGDVKDLLAKRDLTQITVEHLDDGTLAKLRTLLAEAGKGIKAISSPRDKLESLFLRIVKEAQEQRVATGGSIAGGEVAEFLRRVPQGRQLIEDLITAAQPVDETPPEAPGEEAATPEPSEEVLRELVEPVESPDRRQAESAEPAGTDSPAPAAQQADRSVIDDLLDNPDDRKDS